MKSKNNSSSIKPNGCHLSYWAGDLRSSWKETLSVEGHPTGRPSPKFPPREILVVTKLRRRLPSSQNLCDIDDPTTDAILRLLSCMPKLASAASSELRFKHPKRIENVSSWIKNGCTTNKFPLYYSPAIMTSPWMPPRTLCDWRQKQIHALGCKIFLPSWNYGYCTFLRTTASDTIHLAAK